MHVKRAQIAIATPIYKEDTASKHDLQYPDLNLENLAFFWFFHKFLMLK